MTLVYGKIHLESLTIVSESAVLSLLTSFSFSEHGDNGHVRKYGGTCVYSFFSSFSDCVLCVCVCTYAQQLLLGALDQATVALGKSLNVGGQEDLGCIPGCTTY